MIRNREVATLLENVAELLEASGESVYRIRAYRNAARHIGSMPEDIEVIWRAGRLDDIPGVGESIAAKISEFLRTGRLGYLDRLRRRIPVGTADLLLVPGLGPKRVLEIQRVLGIDNVLDLRQAALDHRLRALPGFGEKLEANLLREIDRLGGRTRRIPLGIALPTAEEIASLLRAHPVVVRVEPAGSVRRMRDTIGDIDLLAASEWPDRVIEAFTRLAISREVLAKGPTRASILTPGELQVDLRVVPPEVYGAALMYFTGSREHNIALRDLAQRRGLKLSEYGLFDERTGQRRASASEQDVYGALGLPWIPPELRENRGEIEAALAGRLLPHFEGSAILGDLHVHTNWSDGQDSLEIMVEAARARGYAYVAITDHSPGLGVARGLTRERLDAQRQEIEALNRRLAPFRVLQGAEVNIRRDGSLDYPDEVLRDLDLVCAAIHGGFEGTEAEITARIQAALRHPYVDVLCHPTGRLLGKREPYPVDLEAVISTAHEVGVAIEINSQPDRLDLDDIWARRAKESGVPLVIVTDAHAASQLGLMRYGVSVARRAWLEPTDVRNTRPWTAVRRRARAHRPAA